MIVDRPSSPLFFVLLLATCSLGCTGISTIPYAAEPGRIQDPGATLKALILANTIQGCVTSPEYGQAMLVVKFVCNTGAGNEVLRFDKVASIELQKSGTWFRVHVKHRDNIKDFDWSSHSLEDVQHIEDAIVALMQKGNVAPTPPGRADEDVPAKREPSQI